MSLWVAVESEVVDVCVVVAGAVEVVVDVVAVVDVCDVDVPPGWIVVGVVGVVPVAVPGEIVTVWP